jgi:hypothetical protein
MKMAIKMALMRSSGSSGDGGGGFASGLLGTAIKGAIGYFTGGASTAVGPSIDAATYASQDAYAAGLNAAAGFANGGIMSNYGPLQLNKYARGGIADSPQLAVFGEGSKNEAYVPLPDNRTIPVTLTDGGGNSKISVGDTNIVVNISQSNAEVSSKESTEFAKRLSAQIKATVHAEIIDQSRPGGILSKA